MSLDPRPRGRPRKEKPPKLRDRRGDWAYPSNCALTWSELSVMELLATGMTDKQIATVRECSVRAVNFHTYNIYRKLEVNSRLRAVLKWLEIGAPNKSNCAEEKGAPERASSVACFRSAAPLVGAGGAGK